jgi:hypothetical protein
VPIFELDSDSVVIVGTAHNGKTCRLVDRTGRIDPAALQALLATLIEQKRFGLSGRSAPGGDTIRLGAPEYGHIQIDEQLYRMTLRPYEAVLEGF